MTTSNATMNDTFWEMANATTTAPPSATTRSWNRTAYFMPWPPDDPELAVCAQFHERSKLDVSRGRKSPLRRLYCARWRKFRRDH